MSFHLFIHSYLSETPVKQLSNYMEKKTEPYIDARPTYDGVQPASTRGLFMTVPLLSQCHAAFSTKRSTLACVDQSPISQHLS